MVATLMARAVTRLTNEQQQRLQAVIEPRRHDVPPKTSTRPPSYPPTTHHSPGATTWEQLARAEVDLVEARAAQLAESPIPATGDLRSGLEQESGEALPMGSRRSMPVEAARIVLLRANGAIMALSASSLSGGRGLMLI